MNVIAILVNITLHVQTNGTGKTDASKLELPRTLHLLHPTPNPLVTSI